MGSNLTHIFISSCLRVSDSLSQECLHESVRLGTAETDVMSCQRDGSCLPAVPDVWCTLESEPGENERQRSRHYICRWTSTHLCAYNSPMCVSHRSRVCGWGSTGWQPADWVCCSVDHHEPTDSQTERKPDWPACALPWTHKYQHSFKIIDLQPCKMINNNNIIHSAGKSYFLKVHYF